MMNFSRLVSPRVLHMFSRGGILDLRGRHLVRHKLWLKAEEYYRNALERYPHNSILRERLAVACKELGHSDEAVILYRQLMTQHPGISRYVFGLANTLTTFGRREEADHVLGQGLIDSPDSTRLLTENAKILARKGSWIEAKKLFLKAFTKKKPSHKTACEFIEFCLRYEDIAALNAFNCDQRLKDYYLTDRNGENALLFDTIPYFSEEYFKEISEPPNLCLRDKCVGLASREGKYVNIENGMRKTIGVPKEWNQTIHVLGQCHPYGLPCDDVSTICSQLQAQYISHELTQVRIVNHGIPGQNFQLQLLQLLAMNIEPGDVVLYIGGSGVTEFLRIPFYRDVEYLGEMKDHCHSKGAAFHVIFMPTILLVGAPSEREQRLAYYKTAPMEPKLAARKAGAIANNRRKLFEKANIRICETQNLVVRPHDLGEVFIDADHVAPKVFAKIAGHVFDYLRDASYTMPECKGGMKSEYTVQAVSFLRKITAEQYQENEDIRKWISMAKCEFFDNRETIGSIVVNCNPFTLGHLHLIEKATQQTDGLYIFVVEEDRSIFPFEDRLRLVQEGTAHFGNKVHVQPSGKFIISSFSFPGYFAKEQAITPADSTTDIAIFGTIIAPELKIKRRFVGEKPNCITTNEYNQTMQFLLPRMGIEVVQIPRLESGQAPISASAVRKLLKEGDFSSIKNLVPPTTLKYLINSTARA